MDMGRSRNFRRIKKDEYKYYVGGVPAGYKYKLELYPGSPTSQAVAVPDDVHHVGAPFQGKTSLPR